MSLSRHKGNTSIAHAIDKLIDDIIISKNVRIEIDSFY